MSLNVAPLQRHSPDNQSLLQPSKYSLTFSRLPDLQFFVQSVNLPGLSLSDIQSPTPFSDMYIPGEKLVYNTLNFTYLHDEDLRGYFGIHDWMRGITFPKEFKEYRDYVRENKATGGQYSDATLTINTNSNVPNIRVIFKNCFPIQLADVQFDNTIDSSSQLVGDVVVRFSYFDYERINT